MTKLACCVVTLIVVPEALASRGPQPAHNPKHYKSASGQFDLFVVPTDLYARGAGRYSLTRNGEKVWEGEKAYTLFDAAVTDDGVVAGYAYTQGVMGFPKEGAASGQRNGDLAVVILDAMGHERMREMVKREMSRFLHSDPTPLARGIFIDSDNDRFVLRVSDPDINRGVEGWWAYRLSTGKSIAKFEPTTKLQKDTTQARITAAKPLPGTPLTVVHWYISDFSKSPKPRLGARFTLNDLEGRQCWSLDWPDDYTALTEDRSQNRLLQIIWAGSAVLGTRPNGEFDVHNYSERQCVTFSAVRDKSSPGGWAVRETSRRAIPEAPTSAPADELAAIPEKPLTYLGKIELQRGNADRPTVRDLFAFDMDDRGRKGFIRRETDEATTFVLIGSEGKTVREIPIKAASPDGKARRDNVAWIKADRWLAYDTQFGEGAKCAASWIDVAAAKVDRVVDFDCPPIESVAPMEDGGFVVLARNDYRYTITQELRAFDQKGTLLWTVPQDYGRDDALFSPMSVTVTANGQVAVLENIKNRIQLFDFTGKFLGSIDLEKHWSRKARYPTQIVSDRDGGFLVHDFSGSPPLVWMKADGTVRHEIPKPSYTDGRAATLRSFHISPDNRVWATDGTAIVRLSDKGVVDAVLGAAPDTEQLGEIAGMAKDFQDRLYVVDGRTGAVQVFRDDGSLVRICKPDPSDISGKLFLVTLAISNDGSVYLGGRGVGKGYLRFTSDGKRSDWRTFGLDKIKEEWYGQPSTNNFWVLGYHDLFLVDSAGKQLRAIRNQPDGNWLDQPSHACVAPDGSIAVLATPASEFPVAQGGQNLTVNIYSSDGQPIKTINMPSNLSPYRFAYDGKHIVLADKEHLFLFDANGVSLSRFRPIEAGLHQSAYWYFLAKSGSELWLTNTETKTVHRYSLPSS